MRYDESNKITPRTINGSNIKIGRKYFENYRGKQQD